MCSSDLDFPDFLPARVAAARLALAGADATIVTEELRALAGHGGALTWAFDGAWRCGHCAARRDQFFWRCLRCRRWGTVRLDVGRDAIRPTPPAPRERRELPRVPIDRTATEAALLGESVTDALPTPTLEHGLSDDELVRVSSRPSALARVGSWLGSPFRRKKTRSPTLDD